MREGVLRLNNMFNTAEAKAGPDNAVIFQMTAKLQRELAGYFQFSGVNEDDKVERVKSRKVWYGIIDGEHTWLAMIELRFDNPAK